MKLSPRRAASVVLALVTLASAGHAQGGSIDPQCKAGTPAQRITQDACQKALDLFTYMTPQLGTGLTGGSAISGEHSTLGPGHTSIGIRVNAVQARLPDVEAATIAITGATATNFVQKDQVLPVPTVDAAIGLFRGVPVGGAMAFGVDALLNLSILPSVSTNELEVTLPDGSVKVGLGARVSLIAEGAFSPGIMFSYLRRDLPRISLKATPGSDEITVDDFQVKTSAWRGVIGKSFGPLALSAGFGQDTYQTSALAAVSVTRLGVTTTATQLAATQEVVRDNAFGSVSLHFGFFSLVAEGGRASGGKLTTFNTVGAGRADDPLTYGSAGLRFRF